MFKIIYKDLVDGFNNSLLLRLIFNYTALGKLINKASEPSLWNFFDTYLNSSWLSQLWFRFCIKNIKNQSSFDDIVDVLSSLKKQKQLNEHSAIAVVNLHTLEMLTPDNLDVVAKHRHPIQLADALFCLKMDKILNSERRSLVANHASPVLLAYALNTLNCTWILTQENQDVVAQHARPDKLAWALSCLHQEGILNSEKRNLVANHADPEGLAYVFCFYKKILTPDNFDIVVRHADPCNLAGTLSSLKTAEILTQENFDVVVRHADPYNLDRALSSLKTAKILTQENFDVVVQHARPYNLAQALSSLKTAAPSAAGINQYLDRVWAHRHSSAAAQNDFDEEFGLVIFSPQ